MVMEGLQEDMGEGSMVCTNHPYKNNSPGGICATCLQEKLGKLVSSSFPVAVFPSQSPSSSPSLRSEFGNVTNSTLSTHNKTASSSSSNAHHVNEARNSSNNNEYQYHHQYYSRRPRIMFLLSQKKKKKKDLGMMGTSDQKSIVFKRSKSTTTPRRGMHFMDSDGDDMNPQKRGFWSFLYLQKQSTNRKTLRDISSNSMASSTIGSSSHQRTHEIETPENEPASFDRKVSRSRSVGCGSRSFSGDFFERISTGFGDCTLRRVESQREGKSKVAAVRGGAGAGGHDCIKDRVKCGGIFSGFMIASSSSSSSTSSYWVSSSTEENNTNAAASARKMTTAPPSSRQLAHSRSKSWGWALASPMRAFSKPSGKRETPNKNATPNLSAIPSLLAVRS